MRVARNCEKRLLASSCLFACPSVCPSVRNNLAPTTRILLVFDIRAFFFIKYVEAQISLKSDKKKGLLYMKTCTFMMI